MYKPCYGVYYFKALLHSYVQIPDNRCTEHSFHQTFYPLLLSTLYSDVLCTGIILYNDIFINNEKNKCLYYINTYPL